MQAKDLARFGSRHSLWLALASVILLLGILEWTEWPFLRGPLQRMASTKLERPVTLEGDFGLRLFGPLRLRGDLLVIPPPAEGPAFRNPDGSDRPLLRAEHFALALPWSSVLGLLRGGDQILRIKAFDVARVEVGLARAADGRANWRVGSGDSTETSLPEFERLAVRAGRIGFTDEHLRLDLDADLRTLEGSGVAGAAGLEAAVEGSYRGEPLTARLQSSGLLPLAASEPDAPAVPLRLDIRIAANQLVLDGRGRDLLRLDAFDGSFSVKGESLSALGDTLKVTLPTTAPFSARGRLGKGGDIWNVTVDEFAVGETRLNGRFRYDRGREKPLLVGELRGPRLTLPDLVPAFGGPRLRAAEPPRRDRLLPQREFDIPSLGFMDADVAVRVDSFLLGTAFLEPIEPLRARLLLRDKVLAIDGLVARTSGGDLRGNLSLNARQEPPRWMFDLAWSGVDLERFIRARDPVAKKPATPGKEASAPPGYVSGKLGGRARLEGSGRSTAAMLASLDGTSQWWVSNGRISRLLVELIGLDIAQSLGMLVRGDRHLPVRCAVANLTVRDGVMRPEVAVVDTDLTTTHATGEIALGEERLALRFTAHPRNVSPVTLRSPVRVEGSFADPQVRLDPVSIGSRVAAAAALAVLAPAAAVLALIDLGDPEKAVCQQAFERMQPKPAAPARPRR